MWTISRCGKSTSITGRLVFEGSALARFGRRLRSGETGERGLTVSQLQALIEPLPARYVPNPRATQMVVAIFCDPHREDYDGISWARLTVHVASRMSSPVRR